MYHTLKIWQWALNLFKFHTSGVVHLNYTIALQHDGNDLMTMTSFGSLSAQDGRRHYGLNFTFVSEIPSGEMHAKPLL
jgi:hypothetical protein